MLTHDSFLIGSRWVRPAGSDFFDVISPFSEQRVGRVPAATKDDMAKAVATARKAFDEGPWPRMSIDQRGEYLLRLADLLEPRLMTAVDVQIDEMGGTRTFLNGWTLGIAHLIRDAVALAKAVPDLDIRPGMMGEVMVMREPMGVVAAIIPWNCPAFFVISKILPALLAGCTIVLKPAPETPLSAYIIAEALEQAQLPDGVVSIVAGGRDVGEFLISHPAVDKVSFTGSTAAGRRIASICGDQIKPCTLELGGKSAAILLDDADLDKYLPVLIGNSLLNNGQACVATTRILVPNTHYKDVLDRLVAAVGSLKVGDPHDDDTYFGPLAAERQRERVEGYIKTGIDEGAVLALGGARPPFDKGWFVQPTIFANVNNSMRIAQEEIFGPVVSVIGYDTQEDAIRMANDSPYGLGGGVYTEDIDRGFAVASRVRTGTFFINDSPIGGGGGPAGGYKQSGIGREFSIEGIASHWQLKSVSLPVGYRPGAMGSAALQS